MKCPECGSEALLGKVTLTRFLPLAAKGGSVKVGGTKVSQIDLKEAWDKTDKGEAKEIRGPIICAECDTELFHVNGAPNNPLKGSHLDAQAEGADFFRKK